MMHQRISEANQRIDCATLSICWSLPMLDLHCSSTSIPAIEDRGYVSHVVTDFDQLPTRFADLLADGFAQSFDQTLTWYRLFRKHLLSAEGQLRLHCVECQDGRPAAILAVHERIRALPPLRGRACYALSNYYTARFSPTVVATADSFGCSNALMDSVLDGGQIRTLDLNPLDPRSDFFSAILQGLSDRGYFAYPYFRFANWSLDVQDRSADEYIASLPGALRNTLRRRSRKLARSDGARIVILTSAGDITAAMSDYEAVYLAKWRSLEPNPAFMADLIRTFAAKGWVRLGLTYVASRPVAAQLWFVHNRTASIFKTAQDPASRSYSAGSLLTMELIRHVIEVDSVKVIDYLCGDERYKQDWMSTRSELWGVRAYPRWSVSGLSSRVGRFARSLWHRGPCSSHTSGPKLKRNEDA